MTKAKDKGTNDENEKRGEDETVDVKSPREVGSEAEADAKELNSAVDKAGEEAAKNLEGRLEEVRKDNPDANRVKQPFNQVDAILGRDRAHGEKVREVQGKQADVVLPAHSQNQNNLKHPETPDFVDPHQSKNYLGQPI